MEVHVTVDFIDDLNRTKGTWDEAALRAMVRDLMQRGVAVIHWIDHGRFDNGLWDEDGYLGCSGRAQPFAQAVPDPLPVVCDEAHRHGLRVIAVIKPWDFAFGPPFDSIPPMNPPSSVRLPHVGGMGSAVRFIREKPHVRLRLHPARVPESTEADLPIRTIRIWHDAAELPVVPGVSLWISDDNTAYQRYQGPMQVKQVTRRRTPPIFTPAPEQRFAAEGEFACIELTDLQVDAPFVCVQFDGPTGIANTFEAMVEVLGPASQSLAFTYGLAPRLARSTSAGDDWRDIGIAFDAARGTPVPRTYAGGAQSAGRFHAELDGLPLLAIARGRNEHLAAPIEFAYPEVQQWLLSVVDDALDRGVDGIDIRQSTHAESLDWENYGFNQPVLDAFRQRFDIDPATQPFDHGAWRHLRGEFFDQFLQRASQRTRERGAVFLTHLEKHMALPADEPSWLNMAWHWRDWIAGGTLDAVTMKTVNYDSVFYRDSLALCREHGVNTIFTRKPSSRIVEDFEQYFPRAQADGYDAINLYELAVLATLQPDGKLQFHHDRVWELVREYATARPPAAPPISRE